MVTMDGERWANLRGLFEHAVELPEGERRAFVDRHETDDPELGSQLRRLLVHADGSSEFLESPLRRELPGELEWVSTPALESGDHVGPYTVERVLGSGGMGTVFLARQQHPAREVALKVMNLGLATSGAQRRFQFEADVLARLRHPAIATVFEIGTHEGSAGGRTSRLPYIAMEYVEGARDLVAFAREEGLSLRHRVELFARVCDAVQHAHGRGVIHRDLKPANVLVDGAGQPKVIDFGIARGVVPELQHALTLSGQVFGTLQYSSPEQLAGDPAEVDVRADVHALGLILFELIAGRQAFDVAGRPIREVVAAICGDAPPVPSRFAPELPRELDWIVQRCLRKDRAERYATVEDLAADLRRFLAGEPPSVGPDSRAYRLRKFAARNRLLVGAAALVFALLAGGVVSTGLALVEARDEGQRATTALRRQTAVVDALNDILGMEYAAEQGRRLTLVEILDRRRPDLFENEPDPLVRASLEQLLARAYFNLGQLDSAALLGESALAVLGAQPDADPVELARLKLLVVRSWDPRERVAEAGQLLADVRAAIEAHPDELRGERVDVLRHQAMVTERLGRPVEAEAMLREAVEVGELELPTDDPRTLFALSELGKFVMGRFRLEEAQTLLEDALQRIERSQGEDHHFGLATRLRLATVLGLREEFPAAVAALRDVRRRQIELYGEHHTNTIETSGELAGALMRSGGRDEAEELMRRNLDLMLEHHPESVDLQAGVRMRLGEALWLRGELSELREHLIQIDELYTQNGREKHHGRVGNLTTMARIELLEQQYDLAEYLALQATELADEVLAETEPFRSASHWILARALFHQERFEEALPEFVLVRESPSRTPSGLLARQAHDALAFIVRCCEELGLEDEAQRWRAVVDAPGSFGNSFGPDRTVQPPPR